MVGVTTTSLALTCEYLSEALDETKPDSYQRLLKEELLTSNGDYGVMVMMMTGLGEWAVSVGRRPMTTDGQRGYELSYTSASRSFYDCRFTWDHTDKAVRVSKVDVEIDRTFALALQKAWRAILSRDQHLLKEWEKSFTIDGYSADFSVRMRDGRIITRRTGNAQLPPASEIVTVGYELRDYCLRPVQERPRRRQEIIRKLKNVCDIVKRCDKEK